MAEEEKTGVGPQGPQDNSNTGTQERSEIHAEDGLEDAQEPRRALPAASFIGKLRQTLQRANQALTNVGSTPDPLPNHIPISDMVSLLDEKARRTKPAPRFYVSYCVYHMDKYVLYTCHVNSHSMQLLCVSYGQLCCYTCHVN